MSDAADDRTQDTRDAADDVLVSQRDRDEHQHWIEGRAADELAKDRRERDIWGPGPMDTEPWEPIYTDRWSRNRNRK